MKRKLGRFTDWVFNYMLAWFLIILSPIWLPIWLARKLDKWVKQP